MTAGELLVYLRTHDMHVWVEGDRLRLSAPAATLTPELREELHRHKQELINFLSQAVQPGSDSAPIEPAAGDGPIPLSYAQQRLWLLDQLEPGSTAYNIPAALRLTGRLDEAALKWSLGEIVRRHEALRTIFVLQNGQPAQVIQPPTELELPVIDLQNLPEPERENGALRRAAIQAQKPFDLTRGPLLRASLLRLGEADHILLLMMHHIVFDGWSIGVFLRELGILYNASVSGHPSPLAELPIQYADFARWQRQRLSKAALNGQLEYWRRQLTGGAIGAGTAHRPAASRAPHDQGRALSVRAACRPISGAQ